MIAKVIAWGRDRAEALARLRRALARDHRGDRGRRDQPALPARAARAARRCATGEIDTTLARPPAAAARRARPARTPTSRCCRPRSSSPTPRRPPTGRASTPSRAAGGPQAERRQPRATIELRHRGQRYRIAVAPARPVGLPRGGRRRRRRGPASSALERARAPDRASAARCYRTLSVAAGRRPAVEVDGVPHRISRDDGGFVRTSAPAVVVSVPGQARATRWRRATSWRCSRAMKMEMSLDRARSRGRVREVLVGPNVQVAAQAPLVRSSALETDRDRAPAPTA